MNIWEIDKLIIFIAFIIPGFVSIKIYNLLHPSEDKDSSKNLVEAVTYSCINYSILGLPIYYLSKHVEINSFFVLLCVVIFTLVIFPVLLSVFISWLRRLEFLQKNAPHPIKKPWDYVFQKRYWYWVIIELNDGKKIAGKYASESFASSYPAPEQIYLEECWHLDKDDSFVEPRGGTAGILVASTQIQTIELFKFDTGENEDDE